MQNIMNIRIIIGAFSIIVNDSHIWDEDGDPNPEGTNKARQIEWIKK